MKVLGVIISILIGLLLGHIIGAIYTYFTREEGVNDCMIQYVRNYYPNGYLYDYDHDGKADHVDTYLVGQDKYLIKEVKSCNMTTINDTIYCYTTRTIEYIRN